jgi:hypothetical protein
MTLEKWPSNPPRAPAPISGDFITDFRSRIAQQGIEMAERRRLQVAELTSDHHTLEARIRSWERLFGLALPHNPDHPLVSIIATSTQLTVAQVRGEQKRRWPDPARAGNVGASWNLVIPR